MSMCQMCLAGLPSSCLGTSCAQTEPMLSEELPSPQETLSLIPLRTGTTDNDGEDDRSNRRSSRSKGRRHSGDSQSAGRKEAARLYPLNEEAPCEWEGKVNCGGGDYPIAGCPVGVNSKQQARHHGPDKDVNTNEDGNVHRICHYCHYRWHAKNDKTYDWNAGVWPAHTPRLMTAQEQSHQIVDYMRYLHSGKRKKAEVLD